MNSNGAGNRGISKRIRLIEVPASRRNQHLSQPGQFILGFKWTRRRFERPTGALQPNLLVAIDQQIGYTR